MLWTFLKGIMIGVVVSAPMGPVGMLCVRRTLLYGKRQGLLTGLGATFSDLIYATMTLIGVGAFVEFIVHYQSLLQLVGSVLVIFFALWVTISQPAVTSRAPQNADRASQINRELPSNRNDWQTFWSGFLLTFSNLLIVILYIGLFAQFQVVTQNAFFSQTIAALVGIATGALLWWSIITCVLVKVKKYLSMRSLRTFNCILGLILFLFGIIGITDALLQVL